MLNKLIVIIVFVSRQVVKEIRKGKHRKNVVVIVAKKYFLTAPGPYSIDQVFFQMGPSLQMLKK
jgi:hypothetical protein